MLAETSEGHARRSGRRRVRRTQLDISFLGRTQRRISANGESAFRPESEPCRVPSAWRQSSDLEVRKVAAMVRRSIQQILAMILIVLVILTGCTREESSEPQTDSKAPKPPEAQFVADRDCADFSTWAEASAFYKSAGGPDRDPHGLDRDRDGIPCEALLR